MKAGDLMVTDVATCGIGDSLNRAAQLMWERRCGCVPVLDGEGKVAGLVTDRDVAMAGYTQGKPPAEIPVGEAMSRAVHSCEPGASLDEVREVMVAHRVRRLPVIDREGRLQGLVSLADLARAASTWDGKGEIALEDVALTLAEVAADASAEPGEDAAREDVRERVRSGVAALKTARDEIRVDLNLASKEARDRWRRLEGRLRAAEARARLADGETPRSLGRLVESVKRFRASLKESARA